MSDQAMSGGMVQAPADVEVFSPDNRDIYVNDVEEFDPKSKDAYESLPYASLQFRPWSEKLMSLTWITTVEEIILAKDFSVAAL